MGWNPACELMMGGNERNKYSILVKNGENSRKTSTDRDTSPSNSFYSRDLPSLNRQQRTQALEQTYTHTHTDDITYCTIQMWPVACLTELMANVASCFVTGFCRDTATTQHPHPPSLHIFFVPVSPGCVRSQALSVSSGETPWTSIGAPFSVKDTDVLGCTAILLPLASVLPMAHAPRNQSWCACAFDSTSHSPKISSCMIDCKFRMPCRTVSAAEVEYQGLEDCPWNRSFINVSSQGLTAQCVHRWPRRQRLSSESRAIRNDMLSGGATGCPARPGRQARSETLLTSEVRHRPRHKMTQGKINVLCVCLLIVLSLPVRVHSSVICAYANSSCSTCPELCGVAHFYSLIPPPCHPESTVRPLH